MKKLSIKWSALKWALLRYLKNKVYKVEEGCILPKSLQRIYLILFPRYYLRELRDIQFDALTWRWKIFGCDISEEALRYMTESNITIRVRGYEEGKTIIELIKYVPTTKEPRLPEVVHPAGDS